MADFFRLISDNAGGITALVAITAFVATLATQLFAFIARCLAHAKLRRAWLSALSTELEYLLEVRDEIGEVSQSIDQSAPRGVIRMLVMSSSKRFNEDFLGHARLNGYTFESERIFIKKLAAAYRDIVHTNEMLDDLEQGKQTVPSTNDSLHGVEGSMRALKRIVDSRIGYWVCPRRIGRYLRYQRIKADRLTRRG